MRAVFGRGSGKHETIDFSVWEQSTVGIGEMNILRDLRCQDKFLLEDMDIGFKMVGGSLAKQTEKDRGKSSLSKEKEYDESFLMSKTLKLVINNTYMERPDARRIPLHQNSTQYKYLTGALAGIAPADLAGSSIVVVGDRVECKQDMRHVFLKGYLMLMSFNLAMVSKKKGFKSKTLTMKHRNKCNPLQRLAALTGNDIVIDSGHFTTEELWLLVEMCSEYPNKRAGDGNIYNNLKLVADDLVIVSSGDIELGKKQPKYGSPERMWQDIVNIAVKFDALDDLMTVIKDFRGVPYLLKDINERVNLKGFVIDYPNSHSVHLGVDAIGTNTGNFSRFSNYYSTTKNLVADLLLGKMMIMSTYNMIEELGFNGMVGVPSGYVENDVYFNGHLRNRGLRNESEAENELLREWRCLREGSLAVRFSGKLKEYALKMAKAIRDGDDGFLRPVILKTSDAVSSTNTH